jgi:hypothetical protein
MTMRKIFIAALMLAPASAFAIEADQYQVAEVQPDSEELLEVPIETEFSTLSFSSMTCGDAKLSAFYEETRVGFADDPGGKIDLKFGSTKLVTRFADVSCPDGFPLIQFENGGSIRLTSYFGSWLPSPTWGAVQAYYGNINIPGVFAVDNAKFWLDSNGDLFGALLPDFVMSSKWWVPN